MTGPSRFGCHPNAGATWVAKFSKNFTLTSTPSPQNLYVFPCAPYVLCVLTQIPVL